MKLPPSATNRSSMARDRSSSVSRPKVIAPRQSSLTATPVPPRNRYRMVITLARDWCGATIQSDARTPGQSVRYRSAARPAHGGLREAIRSGRLADGAALPPSRALAADLRCSRWVVTQAYAQLLAEGYVQART